MKPISVLMVDDDRDIGTFMKLKLSREAGSYSFAFVESGRECLDYLRDNEVDCILSDYQMPGMDGMELLLALREQGSDVPFIFLTGQGNEELAREAFKNGAYDYFTKDIGFAHFTRIINSIEQAVKGRAAEVEHRRADEALRASEKFLETIVETEPECVKLIAPDGKLQFMNRAGLDMIQAETLEQVKNKPVSGLIAPEHIKAFNGVGKKVFRGESAELEFDMIGFKGRRLTLETRAVPLRNEKDDIIALLGVTRDITERKQADAALRKSEERLSSIMDTIGEWIWEIDEKGTHTYSNNAVEKMLGYRVEDIIGRNSLHYMHEDDRARMAGMLPRLVAEKNGWKGLIIRWRAADGSYRYLESNAVPVINEEGELTGFRGADRDVTERIETEKALLESEWRLRAMLNNIPDIAWLKDMDGRYIAVNEAFVRACGKGLDNILGKTDPDIWPDKLSEKYRADDAEVINSNTRITVDETFVDKNGVTRQVQTTKSPFYDDAGNIIGTVGIARHIT